MPITADWLDDEHAAILVRFNGTWTDQQLQRAIEAAHALHCQDDGIKHHIVTDFTNAPIISANSLQSITTVLDRVRPYRREYGLIIFVGASRLLRVVGRLLNSADTSDTPNVYYVDILPDAVKVIEDTVARTLISAEALRNKLRQSISEEHDPDATHPPSNPDRGKAAR